MNSRELQERFQKGSPVHILIVGDVMLDEYVQGEVRRISPEAPVPVLEADQRTYAPGGAANVAANVASLGAQVHFGGLVGQDHAATELCRLLKEKGIDVSGLVKDENRPTTLKTRIVARGQQIVRVDHECREPLQGVHQEWLLGWVRDQLPGVDACVLSDYAKGVVSANLVQTIIELVRKAGKPVIVDPKGTDYAKYYGATVLTPNLHEARLAIDQAANGEADLQEIGNRLLKKIPGSALLITQGAQGMTLYRQNCIPFHVPAAKRNVFDLTGAGDTVVGMLAVALGAGASLEDAVRLGNAAAGIVVSKRGTATVTLDELLKEQA
jgi:rfaE bifunctional protein kinase chain/domain